MYSAQSNQIIKTLTFNTLSVALERLSYTFIVFNSFFYPIQNLRHARTKHTLKDRCISHLFYILLFLRKILFFWKIRFQIKMFPKFLNGFNRRLTTLEEVKDIKMLYTQKGIYCINWTFNEISDRHEDNDYNRLITIIIRQKLTKENKIYGRVMMDNNTLNWKWTIRKWIKMSFYF